MVPEKKKEIKRVLCKIAEFHEINPDQIELDPKSMEILELHSSHISTNYDLIKIMENIHSSIDYGVNINAGLAQNLGISTDDYLEILKFDDSLFLIPIISQNLTEHFFKVEGSKIPHVIILSSHAEFEPHTRELATGIHSRLLELSVPSLRIEIREQVVNAPLNVDTTLSRYEVDITRKENEPQIIARKVVNKNRSYRALATIYFKLLSHYLTQEKKCIVIDIHGIATSSPKGIMHPMVIVGDALSQNPEVKNFTKAIEKSSRTIIPNLWIVYRSQWGVVEHSLHLVKETNNIPIIIEIRRDLREDPKTRHQLINLISDAAYKFFQNLSSTE
ncbi:MAG: hypothetical protein HWN65_13060 [Candidatus Helarchaeota archaeon]|nr:hypothetical protein [Candidatus Helarchaeota archaeon]